MADKKKRKPDTTKYVNLGSIKRDGNKFSVKHTVVKGHKDVIDAVRVQWMLNGHTKKTGQKYDKIIDHTHETKNSTEDSIKVKRSDWYPSGNRKKLVQVKARAIGRAFNKSKKLVDKGAWSKWVTFTLSAPKPPNDIKANVDADKGEISFAVKVNHPKDDGLECNDVVYTVKKSGPGTTPKTLIHENATSTSFNTKTFDIEEATSLPIGKYVKVSFTAKSRGYGGQSTSVNRDHVFAKPYAPKITSAKLSGDKRTGTVTVAFDINTDKGNAPVDSVHLHRLQSNVETKAEAAIAEGWDLDIAEDDGQVKGLTDIAAEAAPVEAGTHVWYRVSATRDALTTYSEPYECKELYVAKATTTAGSVDIELKGAGDGWVKLGLTDSQTEDTCIRVSWSSYEDAWTSTDQPESFDVTWLTKKTISGSQKTVADVYVRGLENGTRYWFRAQAVDTDSEGGEVLGKMSAAVSATPSSDFGTVTAYAPANVGLGKPANVSWEFSSDMAQTRAEVLLESAVVASVSGSGTKATIPEGKLASYSGRAAQVSVRVYAGGGSFLSEEVNMVVADRPTCSVTATTLTKQPMTFTVETDSPNTPSVTAYVLSRGNTGSGLYGDDGQAEGDCVWSDTVTPDWTGNGPYTGTVTLPRSVFWDGSTYIVAASVHDTVTDLDSDEARASFGVTWAHQADIPTGTAVPDAESRSVAVTVNAPVASEGSDGYVPGDRFDLYRVTMDGERRIADNLPFGTTVTDRFAPYGRGADLRYIAVTRTSDGDWAPSQDITYELPESGLMFNWGKEESVILPYNVEDSASYEKGYEEDVTLDGTIVGWWDGSARRKASLKTDLIKLQSSEEEEAIGSLAQYAGPVFVRTSAGAAFSANVVPSDVSRNYSDRKVSVSFECSELPLTSIHMPQKEDIVLPTWGGGAVKEVDGVVFDVAGNFPMDDWNALGYSGQVLYVEDPDKAIRNGSGAEMADWDWDGEVLKDANGDVVPLTEEAS